KPSNGGGLVERGPGPPCENDRVWGCRNTFPGAARQQGKAISRAGRSYCFVDGLVSGIKNQRITTASRATDAMLKNTTVRPKLAATTPKSVVPSEAPIPDPVPTTPWAKLKRPVPPVTSAMTSAVNTPNTAPLMPSSN